MKKAVTVLLAAAMVMSVASCSNTVDSVNVEETTASETEITEPVTETTVSNKAFSLPRGTNPVALPKENADNDVSDLPAGIKYLDDTRDLKDEYNLFDAFQKYAIKLHHSTLIVTRSIEFTMDHSFYCSKYENNEYFREDRIFFRHSLGNYEIILEDTEYSSLSDFKTDFMAVKPVTELETVLFTIKEATVLEETDDYIIGTIPYNTKHGGEVHLDYYYYFAKTVGNRVYVIRASAGRKKMEDSDLGLFKEKCLIVFDNLYEDDGKEPYIYDKVVNVSLFGDKHIKSFDCLEVVNPDYIDLRTFELGKIYINPSRDTLLAYEQYGISEWKTVGDMSVQSAPTYSSSYMFTAKDGNTYIVSAFINASSSDEVIKQLTATGFIA